MTTIENNPKYHNAVLELLCLECAKDVPTPSVPWQNKTMQLCKVSTLCLDGHHFAKEELESVGELSKIISLTIFKCLYLARI